MRRLIFVSLAALLLAAAAIGYLWWRPQGEALVLYCALDYCGDVAQAYQHVSGKPVEVVRLGTGPLLARVTAEGHHPHWDIAWFDGPEAAEGLAAAGLAMRGLKLPVAWNRTGLEEQSPDGAYIPSGLTLAGVFVVSRDFATRAPRTWPELLRPDLRGGVGMNNPAISGPALPVLAGLLTQGGGWPSGQTFVKALRANGLRVFAKNDATLMALKSGEIRVAVVQSSAAYYFQHRNSTLQVILPHPAYDLPSVMVVSAGLHGQQLTAARQFMQYVLSPAGNRLRSDQGSADSLYWPLTRAPPPANPLLPNFSGVRLAHLDPVYWGKLEKTLNPWFSRVMGLNQ